MKFADASSNNSNSLTVDEIKTFMKRRGDFEQSGVMIKAYGQDRYFTNSLRFDPINHIDSTSVWKFVRAQESNKDGHHCYRLNAMNDTYDVLFTMAYNEQDDVFLFKTENDGYLHADNATGYGYWLRPRIMFDYQIIGKHALFEVIGKEKAEIINNSFKFQINDHSDCATLVTLHEHENEHEHTTSVRGE